MAGPRRAKRDEEQLGGSIAGYRQSDLARRFPILDFQLFPVRLILKPLPGELRDMQVDIPRLLAVFPRQGGKHRPHREDRTTHKKNRQPHPSDNGLSLTPCIGSYRCINDEWGGRFPCPRSTKPFFDFRQYLRGNDLRSCHPGMCNSLDIQPRYAFPLWS